MRATRRRRGAARLDALRRRIDALDEMLVSVLNARAGCALEIGRAKQALGLNLRQPSREAEVLAHVRAVGAQQRGPLNAKALARLFERIIVEARRLERLAYGADNRGKKRADR